MTIYDYYYAHLEHVFGEERAQEIVTRARIYTEGKESYDYSEFDLILEKSVYPLIGLYRSMILEGFPEKEVGLYLKALRDIAPDGLTSIPVKP